MELNWNSKGIYPGTVETFLINESIISEDGEITDYNKFLQFGIFSFLLWFLPYKREYYIDPKKNKVKGSYFNFYVTGLSSRNKAIFLLTTEKDQFVYPHRNIVITDPLNFLSNGDKDHDNCPMDNLIAYNSAYIGTRGINITLPELDDGCHSHKENIREKALNDNIFPVIFGGWPIPLDVNPILLNGVELQEKLNRDSFFNEFLSIYFKHRFNGSESYSNVELSSPFNSHEIDACVMIDEDLVILETSAEFKIDAKNIKRKIYNLWSVEKLFDKCACFYLSFGELDKSTHVYSFMNEVGSDGNSPHFEIINFPEFLKNLESSFNNITSVEELEEFQNQLYQEFSVFLDNLEENIQAFL